VTIIIELGYDADGNALDYTTWAAFYAAWGTAPGLPLSLVGNVHVQQYYSDNLQSTFFDETVSMPDITHNGYGVLVEGMVGSFVNQDCPTFSSYYTDSTNATKCPWTFKNIGFDATINSETYAIYQKGRNVTLYLIGCFVEATGNAIYSYYNKARYVNCFIHSVNSYGIYGYTDSFDVVDCIVVSENDNAIENVREVVVTGCTLVAPNGRPYYDGRYLWKATDCIFYGNTFNRYALDMDSTIYNCCVYQIAYPDKLIDTSTVEDIFGFSDTNIFFKNSIIGDPKFVNTSGNLNTLADFALAEDSPCRYENRIAQANDFFPTNKLELKTIGAWSYFISDLPAVEDVFLGVVYDDGRKEGTFSPYTTTESVGTVKVPSPANVRKDVPVDDTVGTLYIPLINSVDVRAGVQF
jgi:hypothetical protein